MLNILKKSALSAIVVIAITACGGSEPMPAMGAPLSKQATFVESTNSAEVTIKAAGLGNSMKNAVMDSRKAALWFALYGGTSPILNTKDAKNKFENIEDKYYDDVLKYISYESGIKKKQQGNNQYRITKIYRVNVAMLKEDLTNDGVITSVADLGDSISLPTMAVVFNKKTTRENASTTIGADAVAEYFQNEDFEVVIPDANEKVNGMLKSAMALNGNMDPMYLIALQSGADIYASLNVDTTSRNAHGSVVKKASVSLKVYYTATGKQLAVSTGYSPERVTSSYSPLIQEATNDAAMKVVAQIKKSWIKESKKGKLFKVVATASTNDAERAFYKVMKKVCEKARKNHGTKKTFDYSANCKVDDATSLFYEIEENYTGSGKVFKEFDSGSLLLLKIGNSQNDEFEIN